MRKVLTSRRLCMLVDTLLTIFLLGGAVACVSPREQEATSAFGQASRIETVKVDEQGRLFDKLFLEAISQGLSGNNDAKFALLCEIQRMVPETPEVNYELAQMLRGNSALANDAMLGTPSTLLRKALIKLPENRGMRMDLLRQLLDEGNYDEALLECDTLQKNKYTEEVATIQYTLYNISHNYKKAYEVVEEILRRGGDDEEWGNLLMQILKQCGDADFALKKAQERYEANPDDVSAAMAYIEVLMVYGELEKGSQLCGELLKKYPDDVGILTEEIYCILCRKDASPAAQEKVKNYLQNPQGIGEYKAVFTDLYPQVLYESSGDHEAMNRKIEEYLTLALSVKQTSAGLYRYLINRLDMDQAVKDSVVAQMPADGDEDSRNAHWHDFYSEVIADRKSRGVHPLLDLDSVNVVYEKYLELSPEDERIRFKLLQNYVANDEADALRRICIEGIKYGENVAMYGYYGAMCYLQKGEDDQALALLHQAVSAGKEEEYPRVMSTLYRLIGDLEFQKDNKVAAIAAYEKGMDLYPYDALMANNLAYAIYENPDSLQRAEDLVLLSLDIDPDQYNTWDTYACVLYNKGEYLKAKDAIDKALELMKDEDMSASFYLHAGDIYFKLGKKSEALKFWRKALQISTEDDDVSAIRKRISTQRLP